MIDPRFVNVLNSVDKDPFYTYDAGQSGDGEPQNNIIGADEEWLNTYRNSGVANPLSSSNNPLISLANESLESALSGQASNMDSVNDANVYSKIKGMNSQEALEYLLDNDPENAQGWVESLLGLTASRENIQQAYEYEKDYLQNSASWLMEGLQKAGINPILAYQNISGLNGSVGHASSPDFNVSTNATSRYTARSSAAASDRRSLFGLLGTFLGILGAIGIAMI